VEELITCQLLNVHGVGGVRVTEMHTAEPFVQERIASEFEFTVAQVKRSESPGVNQIPAGLVQAEGKKIIL
jgi:hypothetical protein